MLTDLLSVLHVGWLLSQKVRNKSKKKLMGKNFKDVYYAIFNFYKNNLGISTFSTNGLMKSLPIETIAINQIFTKQSTNLTLHLSEEQ